MTKEQLREIAHVIAQLIVVTVGLHQPLDKDTTRRLVAEILTELDFHCAMK